MVCGLWLIRAQCCLLSSSLHVNMALPVSSGATRWQIYQFRFSLSDALFHRTHLSMKRYGEVVAARLSDFLYDNWWRSIRWSEMMCLPDAVLSWRRTIRIYSHRVCITGLFKYPRIGSGFTLFLSAKMSVISYSAEINFITDKSTGVWQACGIDTDTDNVNSYCT